MLTDWFFELFGPVTVKRGDICSGAGEAAQEADFGACDSHDLHDLLNARNILLWGKNVFVSSPHTIPVLRDARARGARLALVDPVHHRTAELCEQFWQPRPGGDFALAMAVARLLFERGAVDATRAAEHCDNLPAFRALAESRDVAAWCADADVPVAAAEDLAARLADGPTAILVGWGMGRRSNGGAIVRALDALSALSGNLGVSGGGVSYYFRRRGRLRYVVHPRREGGAADDPGAPVRARDPGRQGSARARRVDHGRQPGGDAARVGDDGRGAALARLRGGRRLVHDRHGAPRAPRAADDDVARGRRSPRLVRPPPPRRRAARGGAARGRAQRSRRSCRAWRRASGLGHALAGTAREWKARFISAKAAARGVTVEALEAGPVRNPLVGARPLRGRPRPDGDGPRQPRHRAPAELARGAEFPLALLSLSTDRAQSSQWSARLAGPAVCTVHPEVAAAAGLADGGIGRLAVSGR